MKKRSSLFLFPFLSLMGLQPAYAQSDSNSPSSQVFPLTPQKKVCKVAQLAQVENPESTEQNRIEGTVYSVVGDLVMLELADGSTKHVSLTRREVADMGQLVGKRVVITPFFCNRIQLSPPPVTIPEAIEVPRLEIQRRQETTIPTPVPAPAVEQPIETTPAPVSNPDPIPQTW